MNSKLLASLLDAETDKVGELAIEYGQLCSLPQLTDSQEERLQEILDRACNNGVLSFWIVEIDHILGHETGLLNPDCRRDYGNQKALLREYFMEFMEARSAKKTPSEIRELLGGYLAASKESQLTHPLSSQERPYSGAYAYQGSSTSHTFPESLGEVDEENQLSKGTSYTDR